MQSSDKHYNPAILKRLQVIAGQGDWQGLSSYLTGLSNAQFRTAGYMLGERIVPSLQEADAWAMIQHLTSLNSKAFLVTMLKAVVEGIKGERLHLHSNGCKAFLDGIKGNRIDVSKTLQVLLPEMSRPEDVVWLFRKLGVDDGEARIPYLVRTPTTPAAYELYCTLRHVEHNRPLLVRVARFLVSSDKPSAYNLASLLCTYYGLDEVKGTFALRVQPYQLARIESSYDAFCEIMKF